MVFIIFILVEVQARNHVSASFHPSSFPIWHTLEFLGNLQLEIAQLRETLIAHLPLTVRVAKKEHELKLKPSINPQLCLRTS